MTADYNDANLIQLENLKTLLLLNTDCLYLYKGLFVLLFSWFHIRMFSTVYSTSLRFSPFIKKISSINYYNIDIT